MAQTIADLRDINFVLFREPQIDKLAENEKYADFSRKNVRNGA